jgi:threonine synthase
VRLRTGSDRESSSNYNLTVSIWKYSDQLPSPPSAKHRLTLGEGETPLIASRSIGPSLGLKNLYFKLETVNPSGSFKDRFAAAALSHLLASESKRPICLGTSSGNTGAALAAYSAAAGIPCILAIRIRGFGTDAKCTLETVEKLQSLSTQLGTVCQVSAFQFAPLAMAGVQTIAYELAAQLPDGIDHVFAPAGGGGLVLAVARGFTSIDNQAAVHCVQPEGNDTIATALRTGADQACSCECTTKVSGLQVASVIDGHESLTACRASGGTGHTVDDLTVFDFQRRLAEEEGIFAEPAAAVALAGAAQAMAADELDPDSNIVCLVTGSGFKDASSIDRINTDREAPLVESLEEFETIVRAII